MDAVMRVGLVGGSGFLGARIAPALIERGDHVVLLTRDPERTRNRIAPGAEVRSWSADDRNGLAATLGEVDAVINLTGVPVGPIPWTPSRRRAILRSRLEPTRAIVRALARNPAGSRPTILVSMSGTDGYTGLDTTPATEASPTSDGFLARVCLAWEAEASRARELGTRVVILRSGFVLARGSKLVTLYALPFRLHLGGPLGDGRQWMSWIHIDDLVRLVMLALDEAHVDGIVNAVAPAPARQADVAAAIGTALHRRSWLPVPAPLIRLAMGEESSLALGSRRVVPARALELGFRHRWPHLTTAMNDVLGPP